MSVEDAAKIIISAGMVNPETQAKLKDMVAKARNGGRRRPAGADAPARGQAHASSHDVIPA